MLLSLWRFDRCHVIAFYPVGARRPYWGARSAPSCCRLGRTRAAKSAPWLTLGACGATRYAIYRLSISRAIQEKHHAVDAAQTTTDSRAGLKRPEQDGSRGG